MASFLTEFPITPSKSTNDILNLTLKWISGMNHSKIKHYIDPDKAAGSEYNVSHDSEAITSIRLIDDGKESFGIKYTYSDAGNLRWITEIVSFKSPDEFWISIKGSCDSATTATTLPTPRKPYIVKMLLKEKLGERDGGILTTDQPIFMDRSHLDIASAFINGEAENHLPIIYVSTKRDLYDKYAVDPAVLAKHLGGLGHVVVEPNSSFSLAIAKRTNYQNPYDGAIGVFWPDGAGRRKYILGDIHGSSSELTRAITRDVTHALANRRPLTECSWQFLREKQSSRIVQKLKDEKSTNLNEYIDAFDDELLAKDRRLEDAETEIARLRSELLRKNIEKSFEGGIFKPGKETDFYPNEIRQVALSALKHCASQALEGSRRRHILDDLAEANKPHENDVTLEAEIKSVFSKYQKMDANTKATLLGIGFEITDDGKHYKATFSGDPRYTFSIPKTPSDHRSGKNLASDICKALFK